MIRMTRRPGTPDAAVPCPATPPAAHPTHQPSSSASTQSDVVSTLANPTFFPSAV